MGSCPLLQGIFPTQRIFPTQGSNPGLRHCGQILYQLSHQGSPRILEWGAYIFSSRFSWPRNQTGVSYIAGGFFTHSTVSLGQAVLGPSKWSQCYCTGGSLLCCWYLSRRQDTWIPTWEFALAKVFQRIFLIRASQDFPNLRLGKASQPVGRCHPYQFCSLYRVVFYRNSTSLSTAERVQRTHYPEKLYIYVWC